MDIAWWHWAVLGVALMTVEIFVPGGFLIGMGIAGLVTGGVVLAWPALDWEHQVLWFAALSFVSVFAMRRFLRARPIESEQPLLNLRGHQYVGRRFTLAEPIVNGEGKIKVDDSTWKVRGEDCEAGAVVEITGVDGVVLLARPVEDGADGAG